MGCVWVRQKKKGGCQPTPSQEKLCSRGTDYYVCFAFRLYFYVQERTLSVTLWGTRSNHSGMYQVHTYSFLVYTVLYIQYQYIRTYPLIRGFYRESMIVVGNQKKLALLKVWITSNSVTIICTSVHQTIRYNNCSAARTFRATFNKRCPQGHRLPSQLYTK